MVEGEDEVVGDVGDVGFAATVDKRILSCLTDALGDVCVASGFVCVFCWRIVEWRHIVCHRGCRLHDILAR